MHCTLCTDFSFPGRPPGAGWARLPRAGGRLGGTAQPPPKGAGPRPARAAPSAAPVPSRDELSDAQARHTLLNGSAVFSLTCLWNTRQPQALAATAGDNGAKSAHKGRPRPRDPPAAAATTGAAQGLGPGPSPQPPRLPEARARPAAAGTPTSPSSCHHRRRVPSPPAPYWRATAAGVSTSGEDLHETLPYWLSLPPRDADALRARGKLLLPLSLCVTSGLTTLEGGAEACRSGSDSKVAASSWSPFRRRRSGAGGLALRPAPARRPTCACCRPGLPGPRRSDASLLRRDLL